MRIVSKESKKDSVNRITKENRISIDRDDFNHFKLLKTYFNMKWLSKYVEVNLTGGGYHIIGEFKDRTPEQNINVSRALGDCKGRLNLDEDRIKSGLGEYYMEILFYEKIKDGKKTGEESYNILSSPFWGNGEKWCKTNGSKNS